MKHKNYITLEEHNDIFLYIKNLKSKLDYAFINIDSHSDMSMREDKKQIDIGNFISELIFNESFNETIWIKNKKIYYPDFSVGKYNFLIGENTESHLKSTLENGFFFFQNSYEKVDHLINPKKVDFYVYNLEDYTKLDFKNKKWVLSIDYDFFSCKNPCINSVGVKDVNKILNITSKETIEKLSKEYYNIDSQKKFQIFVNKLIDNHPTFYKYFGEYCLPDFKSSKDEIENSISKINYFILNHFKLEDCLGVYLIKSVSSGFTNQDDYSLIDELVKRDLFKDIKY